MASLPEQSRSRSFSRPTPPKLLLVEDEPVLRRSLRAFLSRQGFSVTEVDCLSAAERELRDQVFDTALVDVCLPDGNGLDLLGRIGPERTVVMTAQPDEAVFVRCGVLHRVDKPLDLMRTANLLETLAAAAP